MAEEYGLEEVKRFERAKIVKGEEELWSARDLQVLLGYATWEKFSKAIERAKRASAQSGVSTRDHFRSAVKMVEIGSNTVRPIPDFMLTRYASYLVAQNGDPRIPQIALAQTYFAVQTRRQEVGEKRQADMERLSARHKLSKTEKEFASELVRRDVDGVGIGQIKSRGDKVLFGGNSTNVMKRSLRVPKSRPLADFLPTVTLKAKDLATEITTFNTQKKELRGTEPIAQEHEQNNAQVRGVLTARGIRPESLKPADDVKKLERRIKREEKLLPQPADTPLRIDNPEGFEIAETK